MTTAVAVRQPLVDPVVNSDVHTDASAFSPRHRRSSPSGVWLGRVALVALAVLIALIRPGVWLPFVTLTFGAAVARLAGWRGHQLRLVAFAVAVFAAAVDYLSWRLTVISWTGWFIGIPLFLAEAHAALHTIGLHASLWPKVPTAPPIVGGGATVPVYVFIPTVDEGASIIAATLVGVVAARAAYLAAHPRAVIRIVVCNDGGVAEADCSEQVIAVAAAFDVECVTRSEGGGAKAGNFEHARQVVGGTGNALLVIFDADQIPREDFFLETLPRFADPRVGWVQTGQYYRNRSNPVARWADDQQSLFYRLLCPAKAAHNAAFICGTNVVIRAAALDEIGGLPTDSVTEDFAASIMLAPRWRSVYLPGVLATGLGPIDMRSYLRQQERWARGTLTVLRRHWRDLILPRRGGLNAPQRLQYGLAVTHYLCGVRDLVFLVAPVLFLLTGISGVRGATFSQFLQHFVPYYALAAVAFWHAAWRTTSWRAIVIGFASAPALVRAAWMTVVGQRGRFVLTPKRRTISGGWRTGAPYLVGLAACVLALAIALTVHRSPSHWLSAAWLTYLGTMLALTLGLVVADIRLGRREVAATVDDGYVQVGADPTLLPMIVRSERAGRLRDGEPRWSRRPSSRALGLSVALVASFVAVSTVMPGGAGANSASAPPGLVSGRVRVGVSGADTSEAALLVRRLGVVPTITGRTFEVSDKLDLGWADRARSAGGTPWITLVLTHRGRIGLDASLTAIRNGVDDGGLARWAAAITRFGSPVYLTVLPEVDRNFAASSAVARDGIPQDVQPAWREVRRIFRAAGATNVAFVWNPADPSHDAIYSPPENQLDAVAVTLFEYPGTAWADPVAALRGAAQRHPGKQLLVEVAAAGTPKIGALLGPAAHAPRTRAAWLRALELAIANRRDISGVVYHDSGPYESLSSPGALPWAISPYDRQLSTIGAVFRTLEDGDHPSSTVASDSPLPRTHLSADPATSSRRAALRRTSDPYRSPLLQAVAPLVAVPSRDCPGPAHREAANCVRAH